MSETPLEEIISEKAFALEVGERAESFFSLSSALLARTEDWGRGAFFQLTSEADGLESQLDDHGARYNRTFSFLRELVASLRGFSQAGFSMAHLERRLPTYGVSLAPREREQVLRDIASSRKFLEQTARVLLESLRKEAHALGIPLPSATADEVMHGDAGPRRMLPRNMGQEDLDDDEQRVAEVASKYLQACEMLEETGIHRILDERERDLWLGRHCSEVQARVYEATVHNLQSTYDTHVKNSPAEASDARLSRLRGHVSAALHLLESVTHLAHFVERHESGQRNEELEARIGAVVKRSEVREQTLNHLLYWAAVILKRGRPLAEDLLPSYTNLQVLEVELPPSVSMHARPAALIVSIVNHFGTPVEMEVAGARCNAASILELLVAVGSHPNARRYVFHGDIKPLTDIKLLFEYSVGEKGMDGLPPELAYLRDDS
ncbi:MAG: HPr family phosphocarrier protein [Planctomycetes bacterium]|nr:HPr family phosphocarrier protein [Planctomycetota bacterium]